MAKSESNVVKYHRKKHMNIGLIIFSFIFIYLIATIAMYLTKPRISVYEVREGSILKDRSYTGLAIRQEKVITATESGYVNYFVQNNTKVRKGAKIYSLSADELVLETTVSDKEANLTSEQQYNMYMEIQDFCNHFKESSFEETYRSKGNMEEKLAEITNQSRVDLVKSFLKDGSIIDTKLLGAKDDGIIVYSVDGMEELTESSVTPEHLAREQYKQTEFTNNRQVSEGDPLYKLVTSEDWKLYFEISEETYTALSEKKYVKVRFKKDEETMWAGLTIKDSDGKHYAYLSFSDSMIRYVNDRFLDVELILEDESGLKIPKSAETQKDFYVVPKSYITQGGNSNNDGVLRRTSDKKGNEITEFMVVNVYYEDDEVAYLDPNVFGKKDILVKPDSNETFSLKEKKQLQGVYNVNKGYAVFKQIKVLCESDEYYIVEEGSSFGLSNYDHIALDGSAVKENDVVF